MSRLEEAPPVTFMKNGAVFVAVEPMTTSVVAVAFRTKSPARLYVQLRSVMDELGQLVPLLKQTVCPETYKLVVVTVKYVPVEANTNVPVAFKKFRLETVPVAAERMFVLKVVAVAVVKLPSVANKLVVVTLRPVAFVK